MIEHVKDELFTPGESKCWTCIGSLVNRKFRSHCVERTLSIGVRRVARFEG